MTMAILRSQVSDGEDEEEDDIMETEQISIEIPMSVISLPPVPSGRSSTETLKPGDEECPYKNLTKV